MLELINQDVNSRVTIFNSLFFAVGDCSPRVVIIKYKTTEGCTSVVLLRARLRLIDEFDTGGTLLEVGLSGDGVECAVCCAVGEPLVFLRVGGVSHGEVPWTEQEAFWHGVPCRFDDRIQANGNAGFE